MLKNYWYAVEFSAALRRDPRKVRVLGKDLVLFRTADGSVACLDDRCAHRGDELSRGQVDGDCLRCPYHGWAWDKGGRCADIPSQADDVPIPARVQVGAYDTLEQGGWIHVFMGDLPPEERIPPPSWPELDDPAWRVFDFEFSLAAHYSRVVENAIDASHLPFLHRVSYGPQQDPVFELLDHSTGEHEGQGAYDHATLAPGPLRFVWPRPVPSRTTFTWHLPCFTTTRAVTDFGTVLLVMSHLPVDAGHTRILYRMTRNFHRYGLFDPILRSGAMAVFLEDKDSVEQQKPHAAPELGREVHVKADRLPLSFRKARRAALDRGWGQP